jgi:hypothetical protein
MTAQIIKFPSTSLAKRVIELPVLENVIVSETPPEVPTAPGASCDLVPPLANRFAHITPKRPRKQRAKMRVEQLPVTCTRVPRKQHADLRTLSGVLTLDFKGDTPWTATFDPDDESIPNIVAPIENLKRTADAIEVACDEGTWVFAPLTDDSDDDEE